MFYTNPEFTKAAKTIETRMINAVINNKCTLELVAETEQLYKEQYINENDYNFLTDSELIKEIHN